MLELIRDEISTSSLKVYPVYGDYDYDKNESPIVGFRAENIILIETTKLDSATSIIDGASEAGANRIDGLRFTLSSELRKEMENLLLQDAVLDAKNRANEALKPLGNSVSDVKTVNLSPIRYGGYDMQYSAKAESFSSAPIFSSSEDVTASVAKTWYELRNSLKKSIQTGNYLGIFCPMSCQLLRIQQVRRAHIRQEPHYDNFGNRGRSRY